MKNKKKLWWLALPAAVILTIVYLNYEPVFFNRKTIRVNKKTEVATNNWMKDLNGELHLSEINIPGVHDAATNHVQLSFFSRCQYFGIYDMLNSGFRYLDIRLGITQDKKGRPDMKLMHGFTSCTKNVLPWSEPLYIQSVLDDCYKFLDENPSETIIMCIKQEHGEERTEVFQNILYAFIEANGDYWYLKNKDATLDEVRGKIVLAHRYENGIFIDDFAGLDLVWIDQPGKEVKSEIYENNSQLNNHPLFVQDHYEYSRKDKWNIIEEGLSQVEDMPGFVLTFLSTKGTPKYGHPIYYARKINRKFMKLELNQYQKYGWLIFDFGNSKIAQKVIETNF